MEESKVTRLSVNINKIATLRNARGGNIPDVGFAAVKILKSYHADGITVHPRPDERHITYADVRMISQLLRTGNMPEGVEFNIEGNPIPKFIDLVCETHPTQVTLVPDAPDALTSNAGWDTVTNADFLHKVVARFHAEGIRVSIFVDPDCKMVEGAAQVEADRVELYTGPYAQQYYSNALEAVAPYLGAAMCAQQGGLEINAGHDLNLNNLNYFLLMMPFVSEVSIGQALISDALYMGLGEAIKAYKEHIPPYFDFGTGELPF
jgi:pyridoxine 5'-phosphate synthase